VIRNLHLENHILDNVSNLDLIQSRNHGIIHLNELLVEFVLAVGSILAVAVVAAVAVVVAVVAVGSSLAVAVVAAVAAVAVVVGSIPAVVAAD
jgi:hypothetical protein